MVIPDSCRSNFRPFYLHPPHALLDPRSLLSPQARSRSCRSPFPGRLPFWASPFASRLANASGRIEFIIFLIMDWSFASGCSPPRLSATQFPSATDSQCSVRWGLPPHCWCALSGALAQASSLCQAFPWVKQPTAFRLSHLYYFGGFARWWSLAERSGSSATSLSGMMRLRRRTVAWPSRLSNWTSSKTRRTKGSP